MSRPGPIQTPQFIPAYSAEAWNALDRESDHEMVLIIDQYVDDVAPIRNGPMAVLLDYIL